jgi:hypothetical protein
MPDCLDVIHPSLNGFDRVAYFSGPFVICEVHGSNSPFARSVSTKILTNGHYRWHIPAFLSNPARAPRGTFAAENVGAMLHYRINCSNDMYRGLLWSG